MMKPIILLHIYGKGSSLVSKSYFESYSLEYLISEKI